MCLCVVCVFALSSPGALVFGACAHFWLKILASVGSRCLRFRPRGTCELGAQGYLCMRSVRIAMWGAVAKSWRGGAGNCIRAAFLSVGIACMSVLRCIFGGRRVHWSRRRAIGPCSRAPSGMQLVLALSRCSCGPLGHCFTVVARLADSSVCSMRHWQPERCRRTL